MGRRVVITGMGAVTPLGNNLKTTWDNIINGRSGLDHISQFDASSFPVNIAGEVKGFLFDTSLLPQGSADLASRSAKLCIAAAQMALEDSGIQVGTEDPYRIGISLGADEEYLQFNLLHKIFNQDYLYQAFKDPLTAYAAALRASSVIAKIWSFRKRADIGATLVSIIFNLHGPVRASNTACSSSGHALGRAKRLIEEGDCDVVVSGGQCSLISEFSITGFYLLGTLSTHNSEPQRASRPFDRNRDGFVMGEGAGILILEELSHAKKRGAHIYAELSGYGSSSNAYRITDTPPDGSGGDLCMKRALADAKKNPSDVDYINAHGTATVLNDKSETLSIKKVFGEKAYKIPISSSKSMLGHLVTASSAVELIISILGIDIVNLVRAHLRISKRLPHG